MKITKIADKFISFGFGLLFILVPLILTPWNYELFEFNKMIMVYLLTSVIVSAWIVKMITIGKIEVKRTFLDIPIALFVFSQFLSAVFSIDPHISWFGYYSRFNGGMLSIISYVLLFYAFVSNFNENSDTQTSSNSKIQLSNSNKFSKSKIQIGQTTAQYNQISRNVNNQINKFLKIIVFTGVAVTIYGVLERLGIDKNLWVQDVQNRVFSTLGQPNWLAAYLVVLIPIAWGMGLKNQITNHKSQIPNNYQLLKSKLPEKQSNNPAIQQSNNLSLPFYFWGAISILFFIVLLFTRSRSGLLGYAVADVFFWGLVYLATKSLEIIKKPFLILHIVMFLIVTLNGTNIDKIDKYIKLTNISSTYFHKATINQEPITKNQQPTSGTLLETGGTESGTIRKYVWIGAVNAWKSTTKTMLIGTGTETFAWAFFQFRPKEHNLVSEWDFLYNKAHNEYLNYLTTTGVFGLGSYLLLIGLLIWWFSKFLISNFQFSIKISNFKLQINNSSSHQVILNIALFSSWISILVTNFFGFSVVIIQLFFFLIPALMIILNPVSEPNLLFRFSLPVNQKFRKILIIILLICGMLTFVMSLLYWRADTLFAKGYRYNQIGASQSAVPYLEAAVNLKPDEPMYHNELASALSIAAIQKLDSKDATAGSILAKQAISESDKAVTISPNNVNIWKTRTKVLYAFAQYDQTFLKAAIETLLAASALSPNDPKILYNIAVLYGQEGQTDQAIETLRKTIDLKVNYKDAYYGLYVFYDQQKKPDEAKKILEDYLNKVDPKDEQFLKLIK